MDNPAVQKRLDAIAERYDPKGPKKRGRVRQLQINKLRGLKYARRKIPRSPRPPLRPYARRGDIRVHIRKINPAFKEAHGIKAWPCISCKGRGEIGRVSARVPCEACNGSGLSDCTAHQKHYNDAIARWRQAVEAHRSLQRAVARVRKKLTRDELADVLEWYGVKLELEPRGR